MVMRDIYCNSKRNLRPREGYTVRSLGRAAVLPPIAVPASSQKVPAPVQRVANSATGGK
jgi:hypothetical protein